MTKPFVISRVLDAPRDRVWKSWTEAEQLKKWWGPKGFKVHTCKLDLRPGGSFLYGMTMPDGGDMWGRFSYREIEAPKRLVFTDSFSDAQGRVTRHPGAEAWPLHMLTIVTFEEQAGGKTKVTVEWAPADGSSDLERKTFDQSRASMNQGWTGTFEQFADYLAKNR